MPASNQRFDLASPPLVAEIDRIATLHDPVVRNLQITQCYAELSRAFASRTGICANWCTFATWASKQAGQTIRREDLRRTLETLLGSEPEIAYALEIITRLAQQMGVRQTADQIRRSALGIVVAAAAGRASEAVSQGNKKVFEEIARQFALFMPLGLNDTVYTEAHLTEFCQQLRPGLPPEGQEYLRRAFTHYYQSLFETDPKKKAELRLLANLEVGFHEQTRLQPEIAAALNAARIDPQQVKARLLQVLFPDTNYRSRLRLFLQNLFQKTALLDRAIASLVLKAQEHLRRLLTLQLMTLTLPPDNCLRLGQDLTTVYPACLQELTNTDLLALLAQVDPTPNSLQQSGATDWASLPERMHFIADLFRCYQESEVLFDAPFTAGQVAELKAGRVPAGRL